MRLWGLIAVFLLLLPAYAFSRKERPLDALVRVLASSEDVAVQRDVLGGMTEALAGRRDVTAPKGWSMIHDKLIASQDAEIRERVLALSVLFGDPKAMALLRKTVEDTQANVDTRSRALQTLVEKRAEGTVGLLRRMIDDPKIVRVAIRGLASYDDTETPKLILDRFSKLDAAGKSDGVATLSSRPTYALALLAAVEKKQIERDDINVTAARQIAALNDNKVNARLEAVWGSVRPTSKEKQSLIERYKKVAAPKNLEKADRTIGRGLYEKSCASCHTLFGKGGKIGPDLTGSQRANPEYILHKVLDPHATVPLNYQTTRFILNSGRTITGLIKQESEKVLLIQTPTDEVRIQISDIDKREKLKESIMPEGLLKEMKDNQVRDLLGYLAGDRQVELPKK